jgi:hypothetical protein
VFDMDGVLPGDYALAAAGAVLASIRDLTPAVIRP